MSNSITDDREPAGAGRRGVSRRQLVAASASGAALLGAGRAFAGAENTLRIGFISPQSGALGSFGVGDKFILDLARKALAHGLTVGATTYEVKIFDRDSQSDPTRASKLAKELIHGEGVDMMLSISTPEVVNPVADVCEAAGIPSLSTICPWESWYYGRGAKPGQPNPFTWSFLFCFGVKQFAEMYLSTWRGPVKTNNRVGVLAPDDADGNAVRHSLFPMLAKAGYDIVDPGGYQVGTSDYSSQIAKFKRAGCQILNGFPIPPDFDRFWRQAAQQGLARQIRILETAKTGIFPAQVKALGPLGKGITSGTYWHPVFPYNSPVTGISSKDLAALYEKRTGRQWEQNLGGTMSLIDVAVAALKASGAPKDKAKLASAMKTLRAKTIVGQVDFPNGPVPHVATTNLIGAQWVKAKPGSKYDLDYVTIEHAEDHAVPVQAKLRPYKL